MDACFRVRDTVRIGFVPNLFCCSSSVICHALQNRSESVVDVVFDFARDFSCDFICDPVWNQFVNMCRVVRVRCGE